jgi:hypothetical protein
LGIGRKREEGRRKNWESGIGNRRNREEGRREGSKEEGRRKRATGNVWDLTDTRKQEKGR